MRRIGERYRKSFFAISGIFVKVEMTIFTTLAGD